MERQILPNVAATVDYVGNVGHDQTGTIDINEGPLGSDGEVTRPGIDVFDPTGTLIPAAARGVDFRRVLQYQTRDAFNTDYHGLELSVMKRLANRWSGRMSYSLSRARDVNVNLGNGFAVWDRRVNDDYGVTSGLNPRADYGVFNLANRHAFTTGGNWDVGRGLGVGGTLVYYTGIPVNEMVGDDVNNDLDDFDRPIKGRDDAEIPILSEVDANGYAKHNTMPGNSDFLALNLRVQYEIPLGAAAHRIGLYWELYNVTNRANFGNPDGERMRAAVHEVLTTKHPTGLVVDLSAFEYRFGDWIGLVPLAAMRVVGVGQVCVVACGETGTALGKLWEVSRLGDISVLRRRQAQRARSSLPRIRRERRPLLTDSRVA